MSVSQLWEFKLLFSKNCENELLNYTRDRDVCFVRQIAREDKLVLDVVDGDFCFIKHFTFFAKQNRFQLRKVCCLGRSLVSPRTWKYSDDYFCLSFTVVVAVWPFWKQLIIRHNLSLILSFQRTKNAEKHWNRKRWLKIYCHFFVDFSLSTSSNDRSFYGLLTGSRTFHYSWNFKRIEIGPLLLEF